MMKLTGKVENQQQQLIFCVSANNGILVFCGWGKTCDTYQLCTYCILNLVLIPWLEWHLDPHLTRLLTC